MAFDARDDSRLARKARPFWGARWDRPAPLGMMRGTPRDDGSDPLHPGVSAAAICGSPFAHNLSDLVALTPILLGGEAEGLEHCPLCGKSDDLASEVTFPTVSWIRGLLGSSCAFHSESRVGKSTCIGNPNPPASKSRGTRSDPLRRVIQPVTRMRRASPGLAHAGMNGFATILSDFHRLFDCGGGPAIPAG
jgi:hypothetical protein